MNAPLKVALLGCGVVGSQVARLLLQSAADLTERVGRELELVGIGVRRPDADRHGLPEELFTTDPMELVNTPGLDVVVEVIGGIEPARSLILAAINNGASVVTANKALIAQDSESLFAAAQKQGVDLYYEAAVAGAVPIIRPLRESLVGDEIQTVLGIVNGTTNYILDQMDSEGLTFDTALAQAQELGFAEADPTADVEAHDAAAKTAILASLAYHTRVRGADVYREGITDITPTDLAAAREMGCALKLLAITNLTEEGAVSVRVHPTMVSLSHPMASVRGAFNAVFVESREAGQLMFLGAGAGGAPSASAVMGDLVTVARNRIRGVSGPGESVYAERQVAPMGATCTRYYLRLDVRDEPGVLAAVATAFADHRVSLKTVHQSALADDDVTGERSARLGVVTHLASESSVQKCVQQLAASGLVTAEIRLIRVEDS